MANVGSADRTLVAALGAILILWALLASGWTGWGWAALVVGVVLLATSAMRFCPAYRLLGMSTCSLR